MNRYESLLKIWCDGMLTTNIGGAMLCPACHTVHGRQDNAILPMMYVYRMTGDKKYLDEAITLFHWQENLLTDIGSLYNDGNNSWQGITVFSALGITKTLGFFGDLLPVTVTREMENRLHKMTEFIKQTITVNFWANINYQAAAGDALISAGLYFGQNDFTDAGKVLFRYAMTMFSSNGLLTGESFPHNSKSPRGCCSVDFGYNAEESLPCLVHAAEKLQDESALNKLADVLLQQLDFMFPDGGWDDSFGCRNYKWTYYGSRTCDGAAAAYTALAKRNTLFSAAARRNLDLMEACTYDGLLYGGPDYKKAGEPPCVHHTITHACGLAEALLSGHNEGKNLPLPVEIRKKAVKEYPEIDTCKVFTENLIATVTGYDFLGVNFASGAGHAAGGTLSALYHKEIGPVIMAGPVCYALAEPLNQQQTLCTARHRSLCPRTVSGEFCSALDLSAKTTRDGFVFTSETRLCNAHGNESPEHTTVKTVLTILDDAVRFFVRVSDNNARFILPLISERAHIKTDNNFTTDDIFFLSPGFTATEYTVFPQNGTIDFTIVFS